jgi:hypothetical protein
MYDIGVKVLSMKINYLAPFKHKHKYFFCFYAEVNFWDFARNDNSNKGTTVRLNETRFGPKKNSSPIYIGPNNLDIFWWNCKIIFRCASIHGRAGFILRIFLYVVKTLYYSTLKMNESYGSVNSQGLWACANILTTLRKSVTGLYLFRISPATAMNDDVHVLIT